MQQESDRNWFATPLGRAWQATEERVCAELLERVFGLDCAVIHHDWPTAGFCAAVHAPNRRIHPLDAAVPERALPFADGELDLIILPHTLDFSPLPHFLLRDVERVLNGEGHLLIMGFNPLSSWALRRWMWRRDFAQRISPITETRARDWLNLLGMEIVDQRRYFRRPLIDQQRLLQACESVESWRWTPWPSHAYALLAKKTLYGVRPLRNQMNKKRGKFRHSAEPAARNKA